MCSIQYYPSTLVNHKTDGVCHVFAVPIHIPAVVDDEVVCGNLGTSFFNTPPRFSPPEDSQRLAGWWWSQEDSFEVSLWSKTCSRRLPVNKKESGSCKEERMRLVKKSDRLISSSSLQIQVNAICSILSPVGDLVSHKHVFLMRKKKTPEAPSLLLPPYFPARPKGLDWDCIHTWTSEKWFFSDL